MPDTPNRPSIVTIAACALIALSGCAKEDTNSTDSGPGEAEGLGARENHPNEASARDAAPGPLSESSQPSTPATDPAQNEPSADTPDPPSR